MHCFLKSLIVIRRYNHFTHRASNHCCQSLSYHLSETELGVVMHQLYDNITVLMCAYTENLANISVVKSITTHFKDRVGRSGCDSPWAHLNENISLDI